MANKAMQELVDLTPEELVAQEQDLREQLFQTRFKNQMRQLDNPLKIRYLRRQLARVQTLLTTPMKAKAKSAAPPAPAAPASAKKKKAAKAPAKEKAR